MDTVDKHKEMNEQLFKRDIILRYLKQADYSLKPSKEIYTRIKNKIIALSGINAKPDLSYAELCKMAGLNLKDGKALINSLLKKELVHIFKRYDATILNQEVEAYYVDKHYTEGATVPDIAILSYEQALNYISNLIGMNVGLKTFYNIKSDVYRNAVNSLGLSENDKKRIMKDFGDNNTSKIFLLQRACAFDEEIASDGNDKLDVLKNIIKFIDNYYGSSNIIRNLLIDVTKKNTNISSKFYAGGFKMNNMQYYLFPF